MNLFKKRLLVIFSVLVVALMMVNGTAPDENTNLCIDRFTSTVSGESLSDWNSCRNYEGNGNYSGIWCVTCSHVKNVGYGDPDLCKKGDVDEN